jgi:hypothetical protein
MTKKKAKGKKTAKRATKKKTTTTNKQELNPAEVRKNIAAMVEAEAETLAGAVIEEGKKGQLPTVKYLFEVAHIYPQPPEGEHSSTDEDSLAKTLLDRLNIPDSPVAHDQYERGEDVMIIAPKASRQGDAEQSSTAAEPALAEAD